MLEQDLQQLTAAVKDLTTAIREQQQAANLSDLVSEVTALRKDAVREPITIDQEPDIKADTPEPAPQPEPAPVKAEAPKEEPAKEAVKPKAEEPTPAPEPKAEEPAPAPEPKAEEPKSEVPDEELLKGMLKDLYSKKGGDVVASTMSKFGVSRLGNVPLEQRAELKAAIEGALA